MSVSFIATIAVIIFLAIFLITGLVRGFLRILLTTFSLIITIVLAGMLAKPLAEFAENGTVIGPRVQHRIEEYVDDKLSNASAAASAVENSFIDALPLTASMKEDLKARNTLGGYVDQGVNSFSEYLAVNLTTLIIRILSYVILFIVIYLVLRLILRLSNVINHIPILGGINRIAGAIVGLAEGVIFLWIISMIIMMMSGTDFGIACERTIINSPFLQFIYEHNYLMAVINGVVGIFKI